MKQQTLLKIKRALTDNFGLKLLALLLSIVLWLLVVNVDDPVQTKTFTTAITVINEEVLTDTGKFYVVPDNSRTVSFRVTAKRSVIERLSGNDFTATADMNYLEDNGKIPVTVLYNGSYSGISISTKQLYMQIEIGEEMSVKHQVDVELTGEPATGCAVESTETDVDSVTVTGPVDVVREISRVVAYVDIDGANEDVDEIAVLHFLDSDGNELDQSKIRVDNDSVKITVKIAHQKTVNIEVQTSGTLADNLVLDSITVSPSTVVVMGDSELLNEMTSLVIPSSVLNLSEITESMTTTVDLTTYLPEGISLADSHDAQAEISVKVSSIETKSFRVPTANLTVQNLGTGLTAAFADEAVAINISGSEKDLASLTASQLTGYVDVSGLSTGSHTVTVYLDLEDDTYTVENQTVQIKIEQQ